MRKIRFHITMLLLLSLFCWGVTSCADSSSPGPAFLVEDITLPEGLTGEVAALDVLPDGRLVAAFMRGEIMLYDPVTKSWDLFASGLHEPLGLMVINEHEFLVMQLPELTRLKDTDGDNKADLFETVYDEFGMTGNYHEFTYGPVKDSKGNLYVALNTSSSGGGVSKELRGNPNPLGMSSERAMFSTTPYRGWVMKITPDGKIVPFASGFRSPNGLVIGQDDQLYVADNQGDWVGSSALYHVQQDRFYGHPASLVWTNGWNMGNPFDLPLTTLDSLREKPAVIFPHDVLANSPSQPVLIKDHKALQDFQGQYLVGEMNKPRIVRVMMEQIGGVMQGSVTPFIDENGLRKGNNRLAFAPDGSLWIGQSDHGWLGDRGIQRVHFTKNKIFDIQQMNLLENGFALKFTKALEKKESQELLSRIKIKKYRYLYHEKYGSPTVDESQVPIDQLEFSSGNKVLSLALGEMSKGFVYEVQLDSIFSKNSVDTMVSKVIAYTVKETK